MAMLRRHMKNGASFADPLDSLWSLRKDWAAEIVGAPTIVQSAFGPVISFDGSTDYIGFTSANADSRWFTGYPFTMACWVKARNTGLVMSQAKSTVSNRWLGLGLGSGGVGRIQLQSAGDGQTVLGTTAINDNKWHHICGVFLSDTSRKLLVDGIEENSGVVNVPFSTTMNRNAIGCLGRSGPTTFFEGEVTEAITFRRALSNAEVDQLYKGTTYDYMLNCVAAYELDQITVGLQDLSVKALGGTEVARVGTQVLVDGPAPGSKALNMAVASNQITFASNNSLQLRSDFSYSAWFRWTTQAPAADYSNILQREGAFPDRNYQLLGVKADGNIVSSITISGGSQKNITVAQDFRDGEWHHVAYTMDDDFQQSLYIDGVVRGTSDATEQADGADSQPLIIGDDWEDDLAKVKVFNKGMSATQVRDLFEGERRGAA